MVYTTDHANHLGFTLAWFILTTTIHETAPVVILFQLANPIDKKYH